MPNPRHLHYGALAVFAVTASSCSAQVPAVPAPTNATGPAPAGDIIKINPAFIVNESAKGDAGLLFDEADIAGDPRAGKGGQPKNSWNIGYQGKDLYYPLMAYVDLGAEYQLSDVTIYDINNAGDLTLETGTPKSWQPLFTDGLTSFQKWNRHEVNVKTRYLHVIVTSPNVLAPEIVLYGKATGPGQAIKAPAPVKHILPTMDEFIGTNAFIDDPLEKMSAVGYIREYHNWEWDGGDGSKPAYPNNLNAFQPAYGGGGAWNFDDYYAGLKKAGITVVPAIQGSVAWLTPKRPSKPLDPGGNASDPASYKAHADEMFQYAARYGAQKVADAKLKLAPGQPRVSGLNLLRYYENGNEPDGWWSGRAAYTNPTELAARCSADYDGHRKSMGDTFGVKNADPNAKLVLAGLAGPNIETIKAMKSWSDWHRDGDFPADVINIHIYSNDIGGQGNSSHGISPEADKLKEKMAAFTAYRDANLPGKELWLTEFGYDTNPASTQRSGAIGETSIEEMQGRWLVRSYFAVAAAGFDRAAQYMLRDVNPDDQTHYSTSGLVTQKGEWKPKPSWYYVYTLKNRLAGMRYVGEVASGNPKVMIYKFKTDKGKGAYAVWCPTSENATVDFNLTNLAPAKTATLVELQNGETAGKASPLTLTNNSVSLQVSERPILVLVDSLR